MVRLQSRGDALEVRCGGCTAVNRVPVGRLNEAPRCGRCGDSLAIDRPFVVTDTTFDPLIRDAAVPLVLDVWAPWCGPCRTVGPELEKVAAARANRLLVGKLNSDDNQATANRFGIRSIPCLLLLVSGREVSRQVGAVMSADILRWVDREANL